MKYMLILFILTELFGQKQPNDFDEFEIDHGKREKRMEMMMVWRLTEELDLTPEQAEKFFPRFRKHREELDELKKMEKALGKDMRIKLKAEQDIAKSDVKATINRITELRKKHIEFESEFLLGMDDILSPRQLANLGVFKQKMMRDIRGELKERANKRNHGKKKKWGGKRRRGF